ncbi:MAG: NAD-dependent epimerase/dehydratase family protein [Candidatus Binatia bacterium]
MKCLVTGAAGFIGSHLAERLSDLGHEVRGVDNFLDYYPRAMKERNLAEIGERGNFRLLESDLARDDLRPLCDGVDWVFHQAAQAGVRASWGRDFEIYALHNVLATQRLLEAAGDAGVGRFLYASSSSVYGDTRDLPMREDSLPRPVSPYGVSKLAAEHLCWLYWRSQSVPTVSLRYFTVYGPRQRPDMAFHRFLKGALRDEEITLYDDGEQTRDFTYVSDVVSANLAAAERGEGGEVFNIGGGSEVSVNRVLETIEKISGRRLRVRRAERQKGDVRHTAADCERARVRLGFRPEVALGEGLDREWRWIREAYDGHQSGTA